MPRPAVTLTFDMDVSRMMVNLMGHCSICLSGNLTWASPSVARITSFQHIWPYLMMDDKKKVEEVAMAKFIAGTKDEGPEDKVVVIGTNELPPICEACGEKVMALDRLHRELQAKVEEITQIIKDTGGGGINCWRRQGLAELLKNSELESGIVEDTFKFLEHVSGTAMEWIEDVKATPPHDDDHSPEISAPNNDWKLGASAVFSVAQMEPNHPSERRRGPGRKAKQVTLIPSAESRYDGGHIKQEVAGFDEDEANLEMPGADDDDIDMKVATEDIRGPAEDNDSGIKTETDSKRKRRSSILRKKRKPKKRLTPKKSTPLKSEKKWQWGETTCEICNETVGHETSMYEHMHSHIGDFVVTCPKPNCPHAYSNPRTMHREHTKHNKSCQAARKKLGNLCETCGLRVDNDIAFRAHVQLHETLIKNVNCPLPGCGERFTVRQSVHPHIFEKHLTSKTIQRCVLCKKYYDFKEMEAHLKDQHQIQIPVKCQQCPHIFPDWEILLGHVITHRHEGVPCYICDGGRGPKFAKMKELRRHYYKEHRVGKQYVCEQCGKEYTSAEELGSHTRVQHREVVGKIKEKKPFSCDRCEGVAYAERKTLISHKIRIHGADPFTCDLCKVSFTTNYLFKRHIQEAHPAEVGSSFKRVRTEWRCDFEDCTATYRCHRGLANHKRVKHGMLGPRSKPIVCEICSKEFSRPSGLKKHRDGVHFRIRTEHICDVCGESLSSEVNLSRHKWIHTGERPFSCQFCGQAFRQKVVLDRHLSSHETLGDKFKPKGSREGRKRFKRD